MAFDFKKNIINLISTLDLLSIDKFINPLMIYASKMGMKKSISFFGMDNIVKFKRSYTKKDEKNCYIFECNDIYVTVVKELFDEFYGEKDDGGKNKGPRAQSENLQKTQMKHELFLMNEEYQKVHTQALKLKADAKNAQNTKNTAKAKMDSAKALANRTNDPQDIAAFKRAEAEYQSNLSRYNKLVAEYTKLKNENNNLVTNINNMQGMYNGLATPTSSETVSENKGNKK